MNIPILFEDESVLVINKPPGIVVNRAESVKGETVQDWIESKFPISNSQFSIEDKDFRDRAGIVHRIDKETSGLLLIAKTLLAFRELQRQFKERLVKKTYLAIVHGVVVPEEGEIRAPVGRLPWNRERFGIVPGGKEAVTRYARISNFQFPISKEELSLVQLYPETGRTHQIRVHLKYINHPIVGDYLYAGRKTARRDRTWAPRVMLHAQKITFTHPVTGELLAFEAPIPDDMSEIHGLP
ncbi:MAG: Pseudouridine synthase [Candidatus Gottesmanbacteria bacterium GW2011_GWA2_47_9]|uniref:Pseudouridine synthase n=2 Tax=Candidatus Gottesmaniibacteriota TaxID=1752720 RepID=A0A0G1XMB5_9BACT|nr:MAG: Pseudouridine synthase [Candidatus Gottesmanbacteria bacterium GW2011_GWA2_47_9]KKU95475.1 MAG: Pseudouridine synthase [Candidatus Gottesmanbacteria bacterium GW2011_GWA1_48_13]